MNKLEAVEILLNCSENTIIDNNWWGYFIKDPEAYNALLLLSGFKSYQQILTQYEGYDVREFLCNVLNF